MNLSPLTVMISYRVNMSNPDAKDRIQFFVSSVRNITSVLKNNTKFVMIRDPNCQNESVTVYYPGLDEVEVDISNITKPARAGIKILKTAASMLYQKRRLEKEAKNPEIARIKKELRVWFKRTHNILLSEEQSAELTKEIEALQEELFRHVKSEKHQLKALKIKRKATPFSKRGPITEEINALKNKSSTIKSEEKQFRFQEKKLMKSIKSAKKSLQGHLMKENMRLVASKFKQGLKSLLDGSWVEKLSTAFDIMRDDPVEEYYDEDAAQEQPQQAEL